MTAPIGLQLYSVRENLVDDFTGTMKKIAKMGYIGIETAGFPEGITPEYAKKLFDDLGLTITSSHSPMPLGEDTQKVLNTLEAIDCPHLVSPWMDPDFYKSEESIIELAQKFNEGFNIAKENGMKFSIHNHAFEFSLLDGAPAIYTLMKYLEPEINFQLDTYWVKVAGVDPVKVVTKMGERAPLLHIKDGPATPDADMTAVGLGVINVPGIIKAGIPHTEWLIVEIDRCATDILEAVDKSYQFLSSFEI
jgi:sugar phosphate isomerase/epimerase